MTAHWNHNVAYHEELVAAAARSRGLVLDVGCGDGRLLERLSTVADRVVGIDPDETAIARARGRTADRTNAEVIVGDIMAAPELVARQFDLVVCIAALHHLPLRAALERLRALVAPGGELRIIGLAANRSVGDWLVSAALVVPVHVMSLIRGESTDDAMVTARPHESLAEIRRAAATTLPGSRLRRRLYFRYSLTWTDPG
ncbi:class I SAM-dependent methyltransferase [Gordonia shandongensis]|uniref:class I SAM-dependent methyltransferase n=1 Tax=Gordonia shandongensis TaxID=376351 RepID=UPI0003F752AE|nr:class I SAM-dependent methyltransferase [Gordonia shandongensis]